MTGINTLILLQFLFFSSMTLGKQSGKEISADNNFKTDREKKVLSLFNVIQFKNEPCTSTASLNGGRGNRMGVCFTTIECANNRGTAEGTCAAGFGVCCVFLVTSGERPITQNCTYIQNPGFPRALADPQSVTYTIRKSGTDVCFLKLNFEVFTIRGLSGSAETDVQCPNDRFTVTTSTNQRVPIICGENTGQHMVLDMGANADEIATLSFTMAGARVNRLWDIKLSQVDCSSRAAPPNGCLQYQTGRTGRLMTFNFRAVMESHLPSQHYSICIRRETGFCCIQYQVCMTFEDAFSLSAEAFDTAMQDDSCKTTDFVGIPMSSSMCNQGDNLGSHNLYCGKFLSDLNGGKKNIPICDCTSPFIVDIFTDNKKNTKQLSKGLCLEWMQVPCN